MDDGSLNDLVQKDVDGYAQCSRDTVYVWINVLLSLFSSISTTEALLSLVIVMLFIRGEMQFRKLRSEILQRNEKDSKTPGEFYTKSYQGNKASVNCRNSSNRNLIPSLLSLLYIALSSVGFLALAPC